MRERERKIVQYVVVSMTSSMSSQQTEKKCNFEPKIGNKSIFATNYMSENTLIGLRVRMRVRRRERKGERESAVCFFVCDGINDWPKEQ